LLLHGGNMKRTITAQLDRDLVERVRQKGLAARRSMAAQASYYIEMGMAAEASAASTSGQAREMAETLRGAK
jgi:hypothetical protein